ncbi:MAG: FAD-dependent monooxygenase [Verrucomicrobia bacterium]|nr:FAD-dependent monooxygenase [Verrucomicrobiota bacterium]
MQLKKVLFLLTLCMTHIAFGAEENSLRILVVGGGLSGLSVAKALQNKGLYVDIIEKEPELRSGGAGIAFPANGSWALEKLGVSIGEKAVPITKMRFTDEEGELIIEEDLTSIHPDGSSFYSIGREDLYKQLLFSLDEKIKIKTGVIVTSFVEDESLVTIEFSDDTKKQYDLVLISEGIHSSFREKIHPKERAEFLNLLVWRTIVNTKSGIDMPTYMLGKDRLLFFYPMVDKQVYVYGHIFQPVRSSCFERFSDLFSSFGGPAPAIVSCIDSQNFEGYPMERSASVRFKLDGFNRILLLGDASHAFGPALQNGAAQAFEDAYVVGELIENIGASEIPAFIDAFVSRRFKRVEAVFTMSNRNMQTISDPQEIEGLVTACNNLYKSANI